MKLSWVYSISRPVEPSKLEYPEPPELSPSSRHHQVESACLGWSLWFHQVCPWCQLCLGPPSVSVLCSPAEVNLRTVWRRQLLLITTPCRQPDLVACSTVVNGLSFGAVALLYSKGSAQRMEPPESFIRGLGILVHPSHPGSAYLQPTSFIGRIFPSLHMG